MPRPSGAAVRSSRSTLNMLAVTHIYKATADKTAGPSRCRKLWLRRERRDAAYTLYREDEAFCAPSCGSDQMFAELETATAAGTPGISGLVAMAAKYGVVIEPPVG